MNQIYGSNQNDLTHGRAYSIVVSPISRWNVLLNCWPNTWLMSCLCPPSYFSLLFKHILSLTIHLIFMFIKCWCLSYVFSAFGFFSYCLPGLFGSGPSQPVWCFLALLMCWSGHDFISLLCLFVFHCCPLCKPLAFPIFSLVSKHKLLSLHLI